MTRTASALLAALLCLVIGTQAASAPKPASLSPKRPGPAEVEIRTVCWHAVALADDRGLLIPHPAKGRRVCERALRSAPRLGIPLAMGAAVLIGESGFYESAVSSSGAKGPWQTKPHWWPGRRYDSGPKALARYHQRSGSWPVALGMYRDGMVIGESGRHYARRALGWSREIEGRRG